MIQHRADLSMTAEVGNEVDITTALLCARMTTSPALSTTSSSTVMTSPDVLSDDELFDECLARAARDAVQSGSLTPIIKEELRCTIQSKRLSEGKDELTLEPSAKVTRRLESQLTEEEKEKRHKRRERNKVAAQKCRGKRRTLAESLEQESSLLETKNAKIQKDLAALALERQKLEAMLRQHDKSTQCDLKLCSCPSPNTIIKTITITKSSSRKRNSSSSGSSTCSDVAGMPP